MALLTVAGNAGGVLVVAVVGSAQCLRPRVLDLPRAFRSDDAVVAEAYFASAEVAVSRGPVVDGVEVVSHDLTIIPQIGNAAGCFGKTVAAEVGDPSMGKARKSAYWRKKGLS